MKEDHMMDLTLMEHIGLFKQVLLLLLILSSVLEPTQRVSLVEMKY